MVSGLLGLSGGVLTANIPMSSLMGILIKLSREAIRTDSECFSLDLQHIGVIKDQYKTNGGRYRTNDSKKE